MGRPAPIDLGDDSWSPVEARPPIAGTAPVGERGAFRPVPPPPVPPGAVIAERRLSFPGRLAGSTAAIVEVVVALVLLVVLAVSFWPAIPGGPGRGMPSASRWAAAAGPVMGSLLSDAAAGAVTPGLRSDLARAESIGPAPVPAWETRWARALTDIRAASRDAGTVAATPEGRSSIRQELVAAGETLLDLSRVMAASGR